MSLISHEPTEEVVNDNPESQESAEPSWWWDKSNPGVGDRPDWLPEKYKSAEDTAKAFKELEKRLGSAPDKYDWSKGKGWVDEEYEPFQKMAEFAKSNHVPQVVMDNMLESVGTYLDEFNTDYTAEKEALGENAENRLNTIDNWAKANFSEETHKALISNLRTAGDVKAIEEMRSKMVDGMTTIPTGNETAPTAMTVKEIQAEMLQNYDKYKIDEGYRAEIKGKIARALET
tara:strand:+ start:3701 stop:4393 length:693 start_codon:yes stop_codon:yes gene_type:complete